jgi:superfamily II DNA helicase RecQ
MLRHTLRERERKRKRKRKREREREREMVGFCNSSSCQMRVLLWGKYINVKYAHVRGIHTMQ